MVCVVMMSARNAGVAQLVRASAFQAEGREFESRLPLWAERRVGKVNALPMLWQMKVPSLP